MNGRSRYRTARWAVYAVLAALCAWQGGRIVAHARRRVLPSGTRYAVVTVRGNVERPGRYRVPEGTSHFQLVQVAGVRATSDLSGIDLAEPVQHNGEIPVGTLSAPAGLRLGRLLARLEFFIGAISVRSQDGTARPNQPGLVLTAGDEVETDSLSQAEVSVGPFTRVDLDRGSIVVLDKVGAREGDRTVTGLYQKTGACWYRVVYGSKGERMRVVTAAATVTPAGNGADFLVETTEGATRIHGLEGTVLVERPGGEEALNLAAGQTLSVLGNRPFQVSARPSGLSAPQRFAGLQARRQPVGAAAQAPVNFLFCTLPIAYYFVSIRYDLRSVIVVAIPPETSVEQYAVGLTTLNEAFLAGGGGFVQSLAEQIVSTRTERYCALKPEGIERLAEAVGGVTVNVDEKAAAFMGLPPGRQRLTGQQLAAFLRPRISGPDDSRRRAEQVVRAFFEEVRSGGVTVTAALVEQVLPVMTTNFTVPEVVGAFERFAMTAGWNMNWHHLPGTMQRAGKRPVFRHDGDETRRMLFGG